MAHPTVVSSPGKVLIAGGYLVLDPLFSGIVVSTSSRFYTTISNRPVQEANTIRVRSPQFLDATWKFSTIFDPLVSVSPFEDNTSRNKFVHLALQNTITLAVEIKGHASVKNALSQGLDIAIVGNNDFYSQRAKLASLGLPRTLASLSQIPPFCPTDVGLADVHKTGLGSSAALITSLVSALLVQLSVIPAVSLAGDASDNEERRLAHNLAQYIHCLAQGKVGSGFDVSAAVFGSHIYTRFDPSVLQQAMGGNTSQSRQLLPTVSPSNKGWNYRIEPFKLPPLTRMMLADVDAGSDTPSLVGKVLHWRKANSSEADKLWRELDQLNQSLGRTLLHLSELHDRDPDVYATAVKYLSSLQPIQWPANPWQPEAEKPIVSAFDDVFNITQEIRASMKRMGALSGVPIEPAEQTRLLDTCISQAGVIGGGVPGAGGYDAVWLLICDPVSCIPDSAPVERIERLWENYQELNVSPLSATESVAKGSRIENLDDIPGLKDVVRL